MKAPTEYPRNHPLAKVLANHRMWLFPASGLTPTRKLMMRQRGQDVVVLEYATAKEMRDYLENKGVVRWV